MLLSHILHSFRSIYDLRNLSLHYYLVVILFLAKYCSISAQISSRICFIYSLWTHLFCWSLYCSVFIVQSSLFSLLCVALLVQSSLQAHLTWYCRVVHCCLTKKVHRSSSFFTFIIFLHSCTWPLIKTKCKYFHC